MKSRGGFGAAVAWTILHFILPVKTKRKVDIHHHEHPQDIAEVNKENVNMHTGRGINLSVAEQPPIRQPNAKKTDPDCLNVTNIANIGKVLLTDMNAVDSHIHLNLFDSWAMMGSIFLSQVSQGIAVPVFSVRSLLRAVMEPSSKKTQMHKCLFLVT